MKILHTVESYLPNRNGMQTVVQEISERLAAKGHDATIATSGTLVDSIINGVMVKHFDCSGNYVTGITGEIQRYRNYVMGVDYDILVNFAAQQWATDAILPILNLIKKKKVFVPTGFSGLYDPAYSEYIEWMPVRMNQYDMNVFHSYGYRDIQFAKERGVLKDKIMTIPNGASEKEFDTPCFPGIRKQVGIPEDHMLILLVGSHTGQKGHAEAIEIFRKADIGPATLVIVGEKTGKRCTFYCNLAHHLSTNNKRIIVCSLSRRFTIALFHAADLFLFPSNIECAPIVLYEAMASRTPFLVTDVGNAQEIVGRNQCGIMLPTKIDSQGYSHAYIDSSVQALEKLVKDKEERKRLGENGYNAWKTQYTWEQIAGQYERLYERLL